MVSLINPLERSHCIRFNFQVHRMQQLYLCIYRIYYQSRLMVVVDYYAFGVGSGGIVIGNDEKPI